MPSSWQSYLTVCTIVREGNADRMKTGNLNRETGSVYFYLINVNLRSLSSEINVLTRQTTHSSHIYQIYIKCIPRHFCIVLTNISF